MNIWLQNAYWLGSSREQAPTSFAVGLAPAAELCFRLFASAPGEKTALSQRWRWRTRRGTNRTTGCLRWLRRGAQARNLQNSEIVANCCVKFGKLWKARFSFLCIYSRVKTLFQVHTFYLVYLLFLQHLLLIYL